MTTTEKIHWIRCGDDLPNEGKTVLIHMPRDPYEPVWLGLLERGRWQYASGGEVPLQVTHWAQIPKGPNASPF